MSEAKENADSDMAFQNERHAEEHNKAEMTGTDGLLYCPLKCKHRISLLDVWCYYIFIPPSPPPPPANSTGAIPPPKTGAPGKLSMVIISYSRLNEPRCKTKTTRRGTAVRAAGQAAH